MQACPGGAATGHLLMLPFSGDRDKSYGTWFLLLAVLLYLMLCLLGIGEGRVMCLCDFSGTAIALLGGG